MHKPLFLLKSSKTPWKDGERERGESTSFSSQMKDCLGKGFHRCLFHFTPIFLSCPLYLSHFSPISASLSRSIHGRRVWMWIEQQIRSVLIMPVKGGLGEHLSLAPSRNGRSPGSWSPPLLPSRHHHSYQHCQARPAPPFQDPLTLKIRGRPLVIICRFTKKKLKT